LDSDAENSLQIELSSALLEEILKTLAEEIHHHDVVGLVIVGLLISNEVKVRDACYIKKETVRQRWFRMDRWKCVFLAYSFPLACGLAWTPSRA
jgi:hypothetical protein